jgi:hypothetical protein
MYHPWDLKFLEGYFWYITPFAFCRNQHFDHFGEPRGRGLIPLPFDNLPQTNIDELQGEIEEKSRLVLPPADWKALIGCCECGFVDTYTAEDVDGVIVPKESEAVFHSDAVCICVEVRCADKRCEPPAKWYVDISGATENDLRQCLQQNHFFGTLPCGHEIRTMLDKPSLRTSRQMNRLWPR